MQNMESDVTKNRLSSNMANNQVTGNLHANAGQGSSLDNHNWKPMDTEDTQTTINQVQEMLEQISSRGVQSMLVTVGPFGEISFHGSQKGQLFLKENSDIGDRFAKMCTDHDVWTLLGAQKRFLEIGRANQNKGVFNEKGDYPLDFSHERGSYFPAQTGASERGTAHDNSFVQDIIDIAGTQRHEGDDIANDDDDFDGHLTELDEDSETDNTLINETVTVEESIFPTASVTSNSEKSKGKGLTTRSMKNDQNVIKKEKKTVVKTLKGTIKVNKARFEPKQNEKYQIKVDVKSGSAEVKRVIKKEQKSPVKRQMTKVRPKDTIKIEVKSDEDNNKDKKDADIKSKTTIRQQTVTRTYNCTRCNEPFPSTVAHNKHLRSKSCYIKKHYDEPEGNVKCKLCSLEFPRQDYLEVHRAVHEDSIPRNFSVIFMDLCEFLCEVETNEGDTEVKCTKCGQHFNEKRLLLHHIILMHGAKYECQLCEHICESRHKCWSHQRSHENQPMKASDVPITQCKTCRKGFKTKSDLERHEMICQTGPVISFPCDHCKKIFSSEGFLSKHKENAHSNKYSCTYEECVKEFPSEQKLKQHQLMHNERSFMCSICGKICSSKGNFQIHMNSHTNERKFECDVCKKAFKTKDVLSKHKRIHGDTRQFCCEICGWGFNQSGSLKKHMDSHLNIKRHQCEVCSKKFANKASLANHKLQSNHFVEGDEKDTVNAEKAKKCEYCDKLFPPNSLYMYKRHVIIHTGVKPHTCDFCGKSFSDRTNFKYHRLTHLETKPFTCKLCGRGFVQKRGLRKHLESSNPCTISKNIGGKQMDIDDFEEDSSMSAFHTPNTTSPNSYGPEMVAMPMTREQNVPGNIIQNVYASPNQNMPVNYEQNVPTTSVENIPETYEQVSPASSSQGMQGDAVMNFHSGFTGDAIATAMAIASAEDHDSDIPKHETDLSNNSGAIDAAWMYVKPWK